METFAIPSAAEKQQAVFSTAGKNNAFFSPATVQPRLAVNQPNDPFEQEADAMADKVMRMEQPGVQLKPLPVTAIQRKCEHCEEEEKKMQRKEKDGNEVTADSEVENYIGGLSGSGQPLPGEVRSFYEPRFGYDFSNVRIHTDSIAAKSAQSINALAYTSGNNIVFNSAQYAPATGSGKRLLAHELTHVVQQGKGIAPKIIQRVGDLSKVPPMACDVANTSPGAPALTSLFPTSATTLTAAQRNDIIIFVNSWRASGGTDTLRVDGYASTPGADEMNWTLSCERALSVANELRNNGVPDTMIQIFAQGETSEFGPAQNNQRADISLIAAPPVPVITSETVALTPGSRARTTVGVGEEVTLTLSTGNAASTWITTAGQLRAIGGGPAIGASIIFAAPDVPQIVFIISGGAMIIFNVLAPDDVHMDNVGAGTRHEVGRPRVGMMTKPFLLPDTVNFNKVIYRELDVLAVANGTYSCWNGAIGHCGAGAGSCGDLLMTSTVVAGKGTEAVLNDCVDSGDCPTAAPFVPGSISFAIPYEYKVGAAGAFHTIRTVNQVMALAADATSLTADKAGAHAATTVPSPTLVNAGGCA